MSGNHAKLAVCSFGCAVGVTWAIGVLILGLAAWLTGWGYMMVSILGSVYIGYAATFWGTVIGTIWALVDGFIGGVIVAAIYNGCVCKKCPVGSSSSAGESTPGSL